MACIRTVRMDDPGQSRNVRNIESHFDLNMEIFKLLSADERAQVPTSEHKRATSSTGTSNQDSYCATLFPIDGLEHTAMIMQRTKVSPSLRTLTLSRQ